MADHSVAVLTAKESAERDRRAIEAGTPSRVLMQNAGVASAGIIANTFREALSRGVEIHVGPGNNGGDGWVAASVLAGLEIPVWVVEAAPPKTSNALDAKAAAQSQRFTKAGPNPCVIIDALLGTGSTGAPRNSIALAVAEINRARERGAAVVALDLPTGLDATTGEARNAVRASLTLSLGTLKRGQLISRGVCGAIKVVDIGLGEFGKASGADCLLASGGWVSERIPPISADAHKGTRKRLAIVAGDVGMAGAAILSGKAALRSGVGLLHMIVANENRDVVHAAIPAAIISTHDELLNAPGDVLGAANAVVIGPGLHSSTAGQIIGRIPSGVTQIVLDAGALSSFSDDLAVLKAFCAGRNVVLTPHPAEMGRLTGKSTEEVLEARFEIGADVARDTGATVLLKGTPTIVSAADGKRMASATGTPALATGGSGDLLSGIVGTLLAQSEKGFESAVCAAWVHGRAAELCGTSRGVTLEDVLFAMHAAWKIASPPIDPRILASLPGIL